MQQALAAADAVVSHGGPGTIMAAREAGRVPIVVPRLPGLGEHVDDHQVRFARRMADRGQIHVAGNARVLGELLEQALAGDASFLTSAGPNDGVAETVRRFGDLVEGIVQGSKD